MKTLVRFLTEEKGTTAIEYGLMAALISVVAIVSMNALGASLTATFEKITTSMSAATR